MAVLLITVGIGLLTGLPAWWVVHRTGRVDVGAPRISPSTAAHQAEQHRRVARWVARRTDPSVITGSLLTTAVIIIVAGLGGVGVLLEMVRSKRGFADFDLSAARFGADHATALSTHALRVLTQFGGSVVLVPVAVVFAVIEVRRQRTWAIPAFLTVAVGGQFLAANLIKTLVDRARPDISRLTGFSSTSFPSGHATAAAASFAALALIAGRGRPRTVKAALTGGAVGLAAMVATSRVLLGVHWLTDVMAGLCLGWGWFALCSVAFGGRILRFGAPVVAAEAAVDAAPPPAGAGDQRKPMSATIGQ